MLLVDEAHSLGVYGEGGRGVAEAEGVLGEVDFVVGTFSKSLGAMGGFCVSPHPELELIRYVSRPFIFTASSSPSIIASTHEALRQLRARPKLRENLWRNANRLHEGFKALGLHIGAQVSPVVAVRLGNKEQALSSWNRLLEAGIYTKPDAPAGIARSFQLSSLQCQCCTYTRTVGKYHQCFCQPELLTSCHRLQLMGDREVC